QKMLDPGAIGGSDPTLKVTVLADARTNSIMLRASNAQRLAAAKQLAQQLDAPTSMPGNMHVVSLRNADAVTLAKTLRGMLGKGGNDSSSSGSGANSFNQNGNSGGSGSNGSGSTGMSGTPPLPSSLGGGNSASSNPMSGGSSSGNNNDFLGDNSKDKGDDNSGGGMIQA
ncbi:MAG: secretin N-terminal domain-containing protein, partial [Paraburkholderia tropica]